jgi:hypothetical protein
MVIKYYWISGVQMGHPFIMGPYTFNKEGYGKAQSDGIQQCGSNFEILTLYTRDKRVAKEEIAYIKAKRGVPVSEALQRQRRGKPLNEASQAYKEIREKEINGRI